jgi:hypothetical protein
MDTASALVLADRQALASAVAVELATALLPLVDDAKRAATGGAGDAGSALLALADAVKDDGACPSAGAPAATAV